MTLRLRIQLDKEFINEFNQKQTFLTSIDTHVAKTGNFYFYFRIDDDINFHIDSS